MSKRKLAKEDTWQCIEFYIKRYPELTREECQKILDDKLKHRRESSALNIEYWKKKYPTTSEQELQVYLDNYKKEHNYQCIEYYQRLYPELTLEQCIELKNKRIKDGVKKRPDNTKENNPGHRSKTTEEERRRRSPMCIEYWEWKYPEMTEDERRDLWQNHVNLIKTKLKNPVNQPKCVEHWLAKGYSIEQAKQIISDSQRTFSKEICISKYGKDDGEKIFKARQEKWQKSLRKTLTRDGTQPPQSIIARGLIRDICKSLSIDVPARERYITDRKTGRNYAIDFTWKDKMIEFNGDYWHCNPKKYKQDFYNKSKQKYASEIWEYDRLKQQCIIDHGYKLLVLWESECKENYAESLQKCIDFLRDE